MHNHHLLLSPPPKRNPRHQLLSKLTSLFSCQWDSTASKWQLAITTFFVGVCGIWWRGNGKFLMLVDVSKKAYQDALTVKEKRHNCTRSVFNIWKNQTYNLNFIQSQEVVRTSTSLSSLFSFLQRGRDFSGSRSKHSRSLVTGKACCNQIIILLGGGKILQLVVSTY